MWRFIRKFMRTDMTTITVEAPTAADAFAALQRWLDDLEIAPGEVGVMLPFGVATGYGDYEFKLLGKYRAISRIAVARYCGERIVGMSLPPMEVYVVTEAYLPSRKPLDDPLLERDSQLRAPPVFATLAAAYAGAQTLWEEAIASASEVGALNWLRSLNWPDDDAEEFTPQLTWTQSFNRWDAEIADRAFRVSLVEVRP
jgi:hypothetical protein